MSQFNDGPPPPPVVEPPVLPVAVPKRRVSHLRFDGQLIRIVWSLAWPAVVYSLLENVVQLADVYMVGQQGDRGVSQAAQAAVGACQQVIMLVLVAAFAVTTGTTTLVAQFVGAGRRAEAGETGRQALLAMVAISLAVGVPMVFLARPVLGLLTRDAAILAHGAPYLRIVFGAIGLMSLNVAASAVFRGAGDMLTPLKIGAAVNVVNIVVNYLYIFGPGPFPALGTAGAAIGTVTARALGGVIGVYLLSRPGGRIDIHWGKGVRPDWGLLRRMLSIGAPAAGSGLLRTGSRTAYNGVLGYLAAPQLALAAYAVGFRLRMIVIFPALAFQVAATTLVGQAIGRGDKDQAERLGWETVKLCTTVMFLVSVLMFVGAYWPLSAFFVRGADLRVMAATVIRFMAVGQVFSALSIAVSGSLAGAGDTRPAFTYTLLTEWVLTLAPAYLLAHQVGLGATGAWWPLAVAPVIQAALFVRRFASGKWRRITV